MFKVYDGKGSQKPVYLKLDQRDTYGQGRVNLRAVDENGKEIGAGLILSINSNGTLSLWSGLSSKLGFSLTTAGKIVIKP